MYGAAARADDEVGSGDRAREGFPGFLPNTFDAKQQRDRQRDRQHRQPRGKSAVAQALYGQGEDHPASLRIAVTGDEPAT